MGSSRAHTFTLIPAAVALAQSKWLSLGKITIGRVESAASAPKRQTWEPVIGTLATTRWEASTTLVAPPKVHVCGTNVGVNVGPPGVIVAVAVGVRLGCPGTARRAGDTRRGAHRRRVGRGRRERGADRGDAGALPAGLDVAAGIAAVTVGAVAGTLVALFMVALDDTVATGALPALQVQRIKIAVPDGVGDLHAAVSAGL